MILNGFLGPYQRGFYCDDESIRYPKLKSEQVPTFLLVVLIVIPSIILVGTGRNRSANTIDHGPNLLDSRSAS